MGCQELLPRRGTSHRKWYNPETERIAPVPDWGSKDLKMGTLRRMIQQLGLDWDTFRQA